MDNMVVSIVNVPLMMQSIAFNEDKGGSYPFHPLSSLLVLLISLIGPTFFLSPFFLA